MQYVLYFNIDVIQEANFYIILLLQIRESTGARIMFPTEEDQDKEVITIMGKKEAVEKAKADLEATIKEIVRES